ncbi:MAG: PIN domain-containing protein [Verrucomicrobia bacterium]|nr:MAG: PIN domain-containing protein [Verrucomicrobiota bacterium]
MVKTYFDTSALVPIYIRDDRSEKMQRLLRARAEPITVTPLHLHELHNAVRLCQFWGNLTSARAAEVVQQIERDEHAGRLVTVTPPWAEVYRTAQHLIAEHTPLVGSRSLDILHVASALALAAHEFCGFDERQIKLARVAGLKVLSVA